MKQELFEAIYNEAKMDEGLSLMSLSPDERAIVDELKELGVKKGDSIRIETTSGGSYHIDFLGLTMDKGYSVPKASIKARYYGGSYARVQINNFALEDIISVELA